MWHLKTRMGTFWVVETDEPNHYCLGVDNDKLGDYEDAELAAKDVLEQSTGYFEWDCQSRVKVPEDLAHWTKGQPDGWQ